MRAMQALPQAGDTIGCTWFLPVLKGKLASPGIVWCMIACVT